MKIFEQFFRIIAPHECLLCGSEGSLICGSCLESFEAIPERCYHCYFLSVGYRTCPTCRHKSMLKSVWIRTTYKEPARKIIHSLKFTHAKDAARIIADELYVMLPALPSNLIISHVPAATSHVRQRGFDQSALIARELSRLCKRPHINTLARVGQQRQVGASSLTRRQQMAGAFRPLSASAIKGSHIILVDDVLTTGSTLESAAKTLKEAGALSVQGAVFAQAN